MSLDPLQDGHLTIQQALLVDGRAFQPVGTLRAEAPSMEGEDDDGDELPSIMSAPLTDEAPDAPFEDISDVLVGSPHAITRWDRLAETFAHYVPASVWVRHYDWRGDLIHDVISGIGISSVLVPQALAYAQLAGVSPRVALYTAVFPPFVYAIFGTSHTASVGPDALSCLLLGSILPEVGLPVEVAVPALTVVLSTILTLMGALGFGFLQNLLSRPLLCGFVNAVALTILFEQSDVVLGVLSSKRGLAKLVDVLRYKLHLTSWHAVLTSLGLSLLVVVTRISRRKLRWLRHVPDPLVVLCVGLIIGYTVPKSANLPRLGPVSPGFEPPRLPPFGTIFSSASSSLVANAILIATTGFVEHLAIVRHYAHKERLPVVAPNRELLALGLANLVGAFFNGFPTFGSLPRSAIAYRLGTRTPLFGAVAAVGVACVTVALVQYFEVLPRVALATVILIASVSLLDIVDVRFLYETRSFRDLILCIAVFVITIAIGVEAGIFTTFAVSLFLVVKHATEDTVVTLLVQDPYTGRFGPVQGAAASETGDQIPEVAAPPPAIVSQDPPILVARINRPLYFVNASCLTAQLTRSERSLWRAAATTGRSNILSVPVFRAPPHVVIARVILHVARLSSIDATALHALLHAIEGYRQRGLRVGVAKAKPAMIRTLLRASSGALQRADFYCSVAAAIRAARGEEPHEPEAPVPGQTHAPTPTTTAPRDIADFRMKFEEDDVIEAGPRSL